MSNKPSKGMNCIFHMGKHSLNRFFMEYKNIFPKMSKYSNQYVDLDVMKSICISALCCSCLEDVTTKVW